MKTERQAQTASPRLAAEPLIPEKELPAYSKEFLSMLADGGYQALHDHLQREGIRPEALDLLDHLFTLLSVQRMFEKETRVHYIWNVQAGEAVAQMSKLIPLLGGHFWTQYGEVLVG